MNDGNYNNFSYSAQDQIGGFNMENREEYHAKENLEHQIEYNQEYQSNGNQTGYQQENFYEYQQENTFFYDQTNGANFQGEMPNDSFLDYQPNDREGYQQGNTMFPQGNMTGYQPNDSTAGNNIQGFQSNMNNQEFANQQQSVSASRSTINSLSASNETSCASQLSLNKSPQLLQPANTILETTNQVNGILQMEGSVEPNGPVLGGQGYIPAQTIQKAYYDLGETPEIKAACLRGFRQQIEIHQEENNFDEHSDAFLLKFLRSRKFDVEAAYSLLEKYYNVRENKPEVFRNLTRKNVKRTMEQGIVGVLPQRDKKGRVIVTFDFGGWNMSLPFHFEKLLRVFVYTLEKLFESEETQINGIVIISNLSHLSVLQTKNLGAPMIAKILEIFQVNPFFYTYL